MFQMWPRRHWAKNAQTQGQLLDCVPPVPKRATGSMTSLSTREQISHQLLCLTGANNNISSVSGFFCWLCHLLWFATGKDWWGSGSMAPTKVTLSEPWISRYCRQNTLSLLTQGLCIVLYLSLKASVLDHRSLLWRLTVSQHSPYRQASFLANFRKYFSHTIS